MDIGTYSGSRFTVRSVMNNNLLFFNIITLLPKCLHKSTPEVFTLCIKQALSMRLVYIV